MSYRKGVFGLRYDSEITQQSGLLLQEDFADVSDWNLSDGWVKSDQPTLIAFGRSPYILMHPSGQAPNQPIYSYGAGIPLNTDFAVAREGAILIDDDGTWYLYYGSSDGTIGWRPQVAKSTDRGLTWEKLGDMGLGLKKFTSPGTTSDGTTHPACDMLYVEKINGTYYLHRMRAASVTNSVPTQPYSSEVFSSSSPIGGWSWIGVTAQSNADPNTSLDSYMGSVIFYEGEYHYFTSDTTDTKEYNVGRYTSTSLNGPWTRVIGAVIPAAIKMQPENPKVFFHSGINRWVMIINQVNKSTTPVKTDRNSIFITTNPLDWSAALRVDYQFISFSDGLDAIGIPSFLMLPERNIKQDYGYIPITFDTDPNDNSKHLGRKLRWTTLEPSINSLKFDTGISASGEAKKAFSHTNFTTEYTLTFADASFSGFSFRIQANGDCYRILCGKGQKLKLEKVVSGVVTTVSGTGTELAYGDYACDKFLINVEGNIIKGYLNGELQINHTDNSFPSGEYFSFVANGIVQVRNFHVRTSENVTINSVSVGDKVTLRGVGGYPIATKTATSTTVVFGREDNVKHFPVGEIEVNEVSLTKQLIWGGDVFTNSITSPAPTPVTPDFITRGLKSFYALNETYETFKYVDPANTALGIKIKDSYGAFESKGFGIAASQMQKPAYYGNSFLFNTSRLEIPNPGITTKASFSCWLKLDQHIPGNASRSGIGDFNTKNSHSHYPFTDGNIYLSLFTSVRKTITTNVIPDRTVWHMFTVTADADLNEWKFYLNDQLISTSTVGTLNVHSTLFFGYANQNGTIYNLAGLASNIHFHNEAFTLAEVQYLFNSGKGRSL